MQNNMLARQFEATRRTKRKLNLAKIIAKDPMKHLDIYVAMERKINEKKNLGKLKGRSVIDLTPELLTYRFTLNNYCCEHDKNLPLVTAIGTIRRRIPISISLDRYNPNLDDYTPNNTVISSLYANLGKNSCTPQEYASVSGKNLSELQNVQDLLFEPLPSKEYLDLFDFKRLKRLAEIQVGHKLTKKGIIEAQRKAGAEYIGKQAA
jgi:hypothetical protein